MLKRLVHVVALVATPVGAAALRRDWTRVTAFLNGNWPPWVSNVANVVRTGGPVVALAWWITRATRARSTEPSGRAAVRLRSVAWPDPAVVGFVDAPALG